MAEKKESNVTEKKESNVTEKVDWKSLSNAELVTRLSKTNDRLKFC